VSGEGEGYVIQRSNIELYWTYSRIHHIAGSCYQNWGNYCKPNAV